MNNTRVTLLQKLRDRHDDEAWEDFVKYYKRFVAAVLVQMSSMLMIAMTCNKLLC